MQILTDKLCESLHGGNLFTIGDISPTVDVNLPIQLQNQLGVALFGSSAFNLAGQFLGMTP